MNNNNELNHDDILQEIFLKPSNEIKTDRFAEQSEGAPCNGMCHSGACKSLV